MVAVVLITTALIDSSSLLLFLVIASAMVLLFFGIKFLFERVKYKYSENTELTLTGAPEESVNANLPKNLAACPSCGNTYRKTRESVCKYCGYELEGQTGVPGRSRLSDEALLKGMNHYSMRAKTYFLSSLPCIIAAIVLLSITGEEFSVYSVAGIVLILAFLALFAKGITSAGTATEIFKVNVVRDALAEIIDGCIYRSKLCISRQRIEATGLFGGWNKFSGNDYVRGIYCGHQIELSDIHLEEEHEVGSGKNKKTVTRTVFRGQWVTCRLNKKLPAVIRLSEGSINKGNAETENVAFNSKYAIYTDDPHTMFYVLTPHFMEYIVAADEAANAQTFFCFAGNTVHIAIDNGHNAFEIPSNKAARSNPSIAREQIKSEVKYITDILDELLKNKSMF